MPFINVLPIVCGSSVFVFVLLCITLCPFHFCNHLEEEEKVGCFSIIVLQMYCYYTCPVALPDGDLGWSAVCDCGISQSFSLILFCKRQIRKYTETIKLCPLDVYVCQMDERISFKFSPYNFNHLEMICT